MLLITNIILSILLKIIHDFFSFTDGLNIMIVKNNEESLYMLVSLNKIFKEEVLILKEAIDLEKEKGKAILHAKAQRLQELTKKSDDLLHSLIDIENQRYTMIGELIEKYKERLHISSINLTNFIKVIQELKNENQSNLKTWEDTIDDLILTLKNFKESAQNLKEEVETNQKLLMRTKNVITNLLDKIEKNDKTYINRRRVVSNALLINQSV